MAVAQANFNDEQYLLANPDVADAVKSGDFTSGWDHYQKFGQNENRSLYTDNAYGLTPEQYADQRRAKYTAEGGTFNPDTAKYGEQAKSEISPYWDALRKSLQTQKETAVTGAKQTYDDVLKNLQEQYNQRGQFFGGEAIQGEQRLAGDLANRISGIEGEYGTRVAQAGLEETGAIQNRIGELKTQAFTDWTNQNTASIEQKVMDDLSKYIKDYGDYSSWSQANENSPWLELPLEDEELSTSATESTPEATTGGQTAQKTVDKEQERKRIGDFGTLYGRQPSNQQDWNFVQIASYGYNGPKDRNKEQAALKTFTGKFNRLPSSQQDWNILHAIAYSGARR